MSLTSVKGKTHRNDQKCRGLQALSASPGLTPLSFLLLAARKSIDAWRGMKSPGSSTSGPSCSDLRLPLLNGLHAWKLSNTKASLGWHAAAGLRCCRGFHDALVAGHQKLVDAVEHENDMHR